ncbi:MAG: carboxylating nicotinate-nucleotide diphosphorylase [candidate division WOR-3 bacterium]
MFRRISPAKWQETIVRLSLVEDIGAGDITSQLTIPAGLQARGMIVCHADGVLAGIEVCGKVFRTVDRYLQFRPLVTDGKKIRDGTRVALVSGACRSILAAERTALNFLCRLSGIATLTARYVKAVAGTRARILDTRKTTPGWRALEKYAVRCGGGYNHRMGLYDMVLIKDNHVAAVGSLAEALRRTQRSQFPVEVEVKTLAQLREALQAGARLVMLDNMNLAQMRRAVELARGRAKLEASGGMTLKRVRRVARTGVDYISVGALTHSAPALDLSLELTV